MLNDDSRVMEKAFVGTLFVQGAPVAEAVDLVSPDDFARADYRAIFEAIAAAHEDGLVIEVGAVYQKLRELGKKDVAGGINALTSLEGEFSLAGNCIPYGKQVVEAARKRRFRQICEEAVSRLAAGDDISELQDRLTAETAKLMPTKQTEILSLYDAYKTEVVPDMRERRQLRLEGKTAGIPTAYKELDYKLGNFQPGQLIIIAARPGVGKTAFALNLTDNIAMREQGNGRHGVLYVSMEMPRIQLIHRLFASHIQSLTANRIKDADLRKEEVMAIKELVDEQHPLYLVDKPVSLVELKRIVRTSVEKMGTELVVIDYLQLIDHHRKDGSRNNEVSEISRALKLLALELKVPIIALSQLSRGVETRQNKRPELSDLRDSGAIEQDADIVLMLYPDEKTKEDEVAVTEVLIRKNRSGSLGVVKMGFHKSTQRMLELQGFDAMETDMEVPV